MPIPPKVMTKSCFITIEGVEGVGKSTNIALIESLLRSREISYITTREPGGTDLGEKIRQLLLDKDNTSMTDMAELLLVFAARVQHIEQLIKPALTRGDWVICDRFTDSSFAYQGYGRGIDLGIVNSVAQVSLGDFTPDLTLLLDLPAELGLGRAGKRGALDRFEQEDISFFKRVRQGYLERAGRSKRFKVVDASKSIEVVQSQITRLMTEWIEAWK